MREEQHKSPNSPAPKKKRVIIWGLLVIPGIVAGWFIVNRLVSPWTVVRTIDLKTTEQELMTSEAAVGSLRVGCYNIAHGRGGMLGSSNWDGGDNKAKQNRLKEIAQLLKHAQLDIIVLNEVDFSSFWSGHVDQATIIAREAGYRYIVEQRNIDVSIPLMNLRFGNAILSNFPLSNARFLDFPHPSRMQELCVGGFKDGVVATATLPNGEQIEIVAVHLSLKGEQYRCGSVKLFMELQKQTTLPMIAMGDFNSTADGWPDHATDASGNNCIDMLLADKNWSTVPAANPVAPADFTFPSQEPVRAIDWICVSSPLSISDKIVIQSNLSDHLPVTAMISKE